MKILIIGGTIFLGRHLIEAALARGHQVTIFNRGQHNPDLYPEIEKLRGDRSGDLTALRGRRWDAVIDTCGYVPGVVLKSAELLADAVEHYTFISSCSVYANFDLAGTDENAPVKTITSEQLHEAEKIETGERATALIYGEMYGALKALCERAAEEAMPGRVLNVRAGLLVGAHDYSDRFTYWVRRVAEGGEVLAPGRPERRVRVIDVRDLAEWIVRIAETRQTGVFNATGAEDDLTMERLLGECRTVSGSDARFTWASEKVLLEQKVEAWSEMPLWLPEEYNGIFAVKNDKAIAAGLTLRPLADTISDTLAWDAARSPKAERRAGLKQERERQLLQSLFQHVET
ncbi:MAG TPA: NAD-dependent epimerase/dehydratase family protein [Pyrinomonadaceae bacterium]|jgi:2'-hydroxyisoflavone reductase|nr:NAD-dependent epimerase/dehydratase family protein [Pyrinomonadaceae bacterium]